MQELSAEQDRTLRATDARDTALGNAQAFSEPLSSFINVVVLTLLKGMVRLKCNTGPNLLFSLPHSHFRPFLGTPELQVSDSGCSGEPHHQDGVRGWAAVVWLPEPSPCPQP